jgi:hypothetical protein
VGLLGVTVRVRESNPRALPSRRHQPVNRRRQLWGSCRPDARRSRCGYRLALNRRVDQINRPIRFLDLEVRRAPIPRKLVELLAQPDNTGSNALSH